MLFKDSGLINCDVRYEMFPCDLTRGAYSIRTNREPEMVDKTSFHIVLEWVWEAKRPKRAEQYEGKKIKKNRKQKKTQERTKREGMAARW